MCLSSLSKGLGKFNLLQLKDFGENIFPDAQFTAGCSLSLLLDIHPLLTERAFIPAQWISPAGF